MYVFVNVSNDKITFIEFACFGDKCFVVGCGRQILTAGVIWRLLLVLILENNCDETYVHVCELCVVLCLGET